MNNLTKQLRAATAVVTLGLLAACNPVEPVVEVKKPEVAAPYKYGTLDEAVSGEPLILAASAISQNGSDRILVTATGKFYEVSKFAADTGASGTIQEGFLTSMNTKTYDKQFDYVRSFESTDGSNNVNGVVGVVTDSKDMPTAGTATYAGSSKALLIAGTTAIALNDGKANVMVDFAAGNVSVDMDQFTAADMATGNAATAPVDRILISDMKIDGNGFSGGSISSFSGGTQNPSLLGINVTDKTAGNFYGPTDSTAPDEVGGSFLSKGTGGTLLGDFAGD